MNTLEKKALRSVHWQSVNILLNQKRIFLLPLLLCGSFHIPLQAQSESVSSINYCRMDLTLGTGQVAAYRYEGAVLKDAPLSGMLHANFSLGYFMTENLMLETGISSLNGNTRFKHGDSLKDFQLNRAAVPFRVGYYFQGSAAFSPFIKIGAYWVASGTATSLVDNQPRSIDLSNSLGLSSVVGLRYQPAGALSYQVRMQVFQNLGAAALQPQGFSLQLGLGYDLP